MEKNNKKIILAFLKEEEKSTSEIAALLNMNYYYCLKILEELEKENLIQKIEVRKFTFWKLKEGI